MCRSLYNVPEVGIENDAPNELMKECFSLVLYCPSQAKLHSSKRLDWIIWLRPVSTYQKAISYQET